MLVFNLYFYYSGTYVSEGKSMCRCCLYIWCMRDELGEFRLIEKLSRILNVTEYIK